MAARGYGCPATLELLSPLDSVTVRIQDNGAVRIFTGSGDQWFTADMDIGFWGDYLFDFTVRAEARDAAGNVLDPAWEKKVEGLFAGLLIGGCHSA